MSKSKKNLPPQISHAAFEAYKAAIRGHDHAGQARRDVCQGDLATSAAGHKPVAYQAREFVPSR